MAPETEPGEPPERPTSELGGRAPSKRAALLERLSYPAFLLVTALLAALLNLFFFCPRVSVWRGLDLPDARFEPDIDRAVDTLAQLADPFVRIESPYSRVIQWRLLFPVLGHLLHLPRVLFLALPLVGVLAALALIAHVLQRELGDRRLALQGTLLSAGCAWFFTSTGWLAYNDSWVVLALVAVSFARARAVLAATVLLAPWIDERFLLLLPMALGLRFSFLWPAGRRDGLLDIALAAAAVLPYLAVRLWAYLRGSDPVTATYVQTTAQQSLPLHQFVLGAWMGLRGLWVYGLAFVWLAGRSLGLRRGVVLLGGLAVLFLFMLFVADDMGRSASTFLPVALAGIVLCGRLAPDFLARGLPWILGANLLLPASHVVADTHYPIYYLHAEVTRWVNPPAYLTPLYYHDQGLEYLRRGQIDAASERFERALQVDPDFAPARSQRASIRASRADFAGALADLDVLIARGEDLADSLLQRGRCREALGDAPAARADYEQALSQAPPDWTLRALAEARLAELRKLGR